MLTAKGQNVEAPSDGSAAQIPLYSLLSDGRVLDKLKESKCYPRGFVLFEEGQQPRGVYALCEGRAKLSIGSPDGKTLVLRIAEPGELLGVNAALSGQPYETTVETLEHCRIDFISREDLLTLLERDRTACLGVAQALSQELSGVVEHTRLLLLSQSAVEKLARLLIRWCDESGKQSPQGTRIENGLTHEMMAQMICTSRETVTRLFSELKQKRIITLEDNAIFIRNRKALESIARCENDGLNVMAVTANRRR